MVRINGRYLAVPKVRNVLWLSYLTIFLSNFQIRTWIAPNNSPRRSWN